MILSENMDYPVEQIQSMFGWRYFKGFTGKACAVCKKKCNVVINPWWMCPNCGTHNEISDPDQSPIFENPDFGPPQERIQEAYRLWEEQNASG